MKNARAIAVMAKAPVPGAVKTRLVPFLTQGEAVLLYRAFLLDTFALLNGFPDADIIVAYTPESAEDEFSALSPPGAVLLAQEGRGLGERLFNVFARLFERGYKKVVAIGGDSPDMPPEHVGEAFSLLDYGERRVVLGPATDGGYYLIAMGRLVKEAFDNIPWSTEKVLDKTVERLKEASVPVSLVSPWHDIDRVSDLGLLFQTRRAEKSMGFLEENLIAERLADRGKRPVVD